MPRFDAALPVLLVLALAAGADEPKTITVRGKGSVKARPDVLTITIGTSGKAEKAADATLKLKKKIEALESDLKGVLKEKGIEGATIEDTGVTFCSGCSGGQTVTIMRGGGTAVGAGEGDEEMVATSDVTVTVAKVDKMASEDVATLVSALLDKGNASGGDQNEQQMPGNMRVFQAQMMPSPVQFTFSNPEEALNKAWDEAVKKAKARAEAIASRLGLAVGGAVRVRDLSDRDDAAAKSAANLALFYLQQGGKRSGASSETELGVQLEVEFELKKADGEKK